jgi:hypothetical protein
MSQPDGNSPQFPGPVLAQAFVTPTGEAMRRIVRTNGTTKVNVFGTTNGISGTILGVKTIAQDATGGFITLTKNDTGTEAGIASNIVKGTTVGGVAGTAFSATAFAATGTMTVVSSSAGNAVVEIDFIMSDPRLPGAQ